MSAMLRSGWLGAGHRALRLGQCQKGWVHRVGTLGAATRMGPAAPPRCYLAQQPRASRNHHLLLQPHRQHHHHHHQHSLCHELLQHQLRRLPALLLPL